MPRLALFDLDDTLLDHRGSVERGILSHVGALGTPYDAVPDPVLLWKELEETHYHRYLSGEVGFAEQRRVRAQHFARAGGVDLDAPSADAWFDAYFERYRASWTLFDDALPCLDALAGAGVRIGVITNGEADYQHVKLVRTGLDGRFEHVVASGAVGVAKPDPAIFLTACERFGVAPSDALYVGDRLLTDAVGAARAGLTGVWLNRFGEDVPIGAIGHGPVSQEETPAAVAEREGVRTIATLAQLPAVLGL